MLRPRFDELMALYRLHHLKALLSPYFEMTTDDSRWRRRKHVDCLNYEKYLFFIQSSYVCVAADQPERHLCWRKLVLNFEMQVEIYEKIKSDRDYKSVTSHKLDCTRSGTYFIESVITQVVRNEYRAITKYFCIIVHVMCITAGSWSH